MTTFASSTASSTAVLEPETKVALGIAAADHLPSSNQSKLKDALDVASRRVALAERYVEPSLREMDEIGGPY